MSQVAEAPRFKCEGCGKSYAWKAELSKKRVKCKCGHAMTVPDLAAPPPPPPPEPVDEMHEGPPTLPNEDIYDMIDTAPAIAPPRAAVAVAAVAAPAATPTKKAAVARKPQPLGYRGAPTPRERSRNSLETYHDIKRDVYLPAALVVGSFVIYLGWLLIRGEANSAVSIGAFAAVMAAIFLVKTIFMVGAAFIVAPMAGVSFGPIWTAILKLAAVSMAPDVFASILEDVIHVQGGGIIASALALGLYWFLMSLLFQFDASDAWTVVIYFGVLRWLLSIVIAMFVFTMVFNGMAMGGGGGSGSASGSSTAAVSSSVAEFDQSVEEAKDNNGLMSPEDVFARAKQGGMKTYVQAFKDAGAVEIWFSVERDINGKIEPSSLIVQWPRNADARKRLLAAMETYRKAATHDDDPWTDDGGKYAELPLPSK